MANLQTSSKKRIDVFDGLKGVSIILIIIYYFFQHILPGGYLAVNFFLFIAGFFNFRHFYIKDVQGRQVNSMTFLKTRFNRLFFPMLAMLLTVASYIVIFARQYLFNLRWMGLSSLLFVNNIYQSFNHQSYFVQAANPSAYNHLWYVSLLGQLIFFTPIIIKLFYSWHRRPTITINMLLILTILSAFLMGYLYKHDQDPSGLYFGLLTRAFAYTFGGVIGLLYPVNLSAKPMEGKVKVVFNVFGFLMIILLFLMLNFMYGTQAFAYRYGMSLFTLVSGVLVIVSIHPSTLWNKLFSFPPFVYIGKRSYSYYLWFYPIYLLLPHLFQKLGLTYWTSIGAQFLLIAILSEISYRLFEQKVVSLPFGQDFNWKKMKYQLNYLKNHNQGLLGIKFLTGLMTIIGLVGGVSMLIAPEQKAETSDNIQNIIESNQKLAEDTQKEDTENTKIVNQIEGLDQQELLYANGLDVTFIGDSVLLASASELKFVFPKAVINGEVGRQLYNSIPVIHSLQEANLLKPTVVIMLGSNGAFTQSQINDFIDSIGNNHSIFLVTATAERGWVAESNAQLLQAAQRYGNVHIIDWYSYSNDQTDWNYDDFGHPSEIGAKKLAVFVAKEIYRQR